MAHASRVPSVVSFTPKKFPSEFESMFFARSQSSKQNMAAEKVMVTGSDRRRCITKDEYQGIGLLRMEFNGRPFIGTASIIAHSDGKCLLTCAHNLVDYDVTTDKFVFAANAWFEIRENKGSAGMGSVLKKRYEVTKMAVHPQYFDDPTSASGYDLALCWIHVPEHDHTLKNLQRPCVYPIAGDVGTCHACVVGFPGEHKGEKWGMVGDVPDDKREDWEFRYYVDEPWKTKDLDKKKILVYDFIDTSPGQSGSPVLISDMLLGIHTGGSASLKKNWATYITPSKLQWIADSLGSPWNVHNDNCTLYVSPY